MYSSVTCLLWTMCYIQWHTWFLYLDILKDLKFFLTHLELVTCLSSTLNQFLFSQELTTLFRWLLMPQPGKSSLCPFSFFILPGLHPPYSIYHWYHLLIVKNRTCSLIKQLQSFQSECKFSKTLSLKHVDMKAEKRKNACILIDKTSSILFRT